MTKVPRVVIITRPTDYESLLARHGTREQARFYLQTRGRSVEEVESRHRRFEAAVVQLTQAIPTAWRRVRVNRPDLPQFVFEPEDIVVAVGQDGLVANVAKYLSGHLVIGLNPDPRWYQGVLVPHPPEAAGPLLLAAAEGRCRFQSRTMVEAVVDDGQRLLALNEVFVGHSSHQSSRYVLRHARREERPLFLGPDHLHGHRGNRMGTVNLQPASQFVAPANAGRANARVLRSRTVAKRLHRNLSLDRAAPGGRGTRDCLRDE